MSFRFIPDDNIKDVLHVVPAVHRDHRGYFKEIFSSTEFDSIINQIHLTCFSKTEKSGSVRGLHFQEPPYEQGKLVCCISGSIFDVALDIREKSETFGKWTSTTLSSSGHKMLWIPPGFAHGFQTIEDDTEVLYFVTEKYIPESGRVINPLDDKVGVEWPLGITEISQKDKNGEEFESYLSTE